MVGSKRGKRLAGGLLPVYDKVQIKYSHIVLPKLTFCSFRLTNVPMFQTGIYE